MNKYVLRTSLVWIAVLAILAGVWVYRSRWSHTLQTMNMPMSGDVQPVAAGPASEMAKSSSSMPGISMPEAKDTALAPLQLTPERMQSLGVKTGVVEYKQLSDDIRATGTVDIDERLLSYVQVRFPGYIRKVFANATYQFVRKGEPLFTVYSLTSWQHNRNISSHSRTRRYCSQAVWMAWPPEQHRSPLLPSNG